MKTRRIGIVLAFSVGMAYAQNARLRFEVASVRPTQPGTHGTSLHAEHGRLTAANCSLRWLIRAAYRVRNYQLIGGPDWLDSERFDIIAKTPGDPRLEDMMQMLQSLLVDRFHLAVHRDSKLVTGYVLGVAKGGAKLRKPASNESNQQEPRYTTRGKFRAQKVSIDRIVDFLSGEIDSPVSDKTGLAGEFQMDLEWAPEYRNRPAESGDGPSIFTAIQEQLGLKLSPGKVEVETVIIDHVERVPVEN